MYEQEIALDSEINVLKMEWMIVPHLNELNDERRRRRRLAI